MSIRNNIRLLFLCLFVLTSCKPYKKPTVDIPANWYSHDSKAIIQSVQGSQPEWWKKFNDPVLNALIERSLIKNNDLGIAAGNILEARAVLQKVQYSWLPSLEFIGTAFSANASDFNISLPSVIPQLPHTSQTLEFTGYAGGRVPIYSLNILKQIKLGQLAKSSLAKEMAGKRAVYLGLTSQVTNSYLMLLGLKKQLRLQEKLIHDAKSLQHYTQLQYQQGAVSRIRVVSLEQFVALLEKKKPEIIHDITRTQNALRVLLNDNPGPIITNNDFNRIKTNGLIPIYLPSETLRVRPDIAIAEYQLEESHALVGVAISDLFPSLSLTGLGGIASLELGRLLTLGNNVALGQIIAGIPIAKMTVYADIAKAKGKKYKAYFNYIKTIREALADVDNALSNHESKNVTYTAQAKALAKAKEEYRLLYNQYKEGAIAYSQTIGSQLNIDYMEANINQVKIQQVSSIVGVYQAFGG